MLALWLMACGGGRPVPSESDTDTDTDADTDTDSDSDTDTDTETTRTDTGHQDDDPTVEDDQDGDGFPQIQDCDDTDPHIHPEATEVVADNVDQNCDGIELCYRDTDHDTWGTGPMEHFGLDCSVMGVSQRTGDCDDANSAIAPGAPDLPGDGIDQNCDGVP